MSLQPSYSIAIIGAGVAGLAAACCLKRAGHKPIIFERFEKAKPVGSGLMIQPTGLCVLERLGVLEQAEHLGSKIRYLYGRVAPQGRVTFDLRYDVLGQDIYALAMHRASLFHVLALAAREHDVTLSESTEIVAVEDHTTRPVLIDSTGRRFGPFDFVIDASGTRSRLREQVLKTTIRPYSYGAVWGVARDTGFDRDGLQQRYKKASILIGVLPVGRLPDDPEPVNAFFWSMPAHQLEKWHETDLDAWRETVAALWPETAALTAQFTRHDQLIPASYNQFTLRRPWSGNVLFIGDAAHSTSPQLGQGANMALLDAALFADALALHGDCQQALPVFLAQRRSHVRFYQIASYILTQFFQSDSRVAPLIRDATFSRFSWIPWVRKEMARTLSGIKTGVFSYSTPEHLASLDTHDRQVLRLEWSDRNTTPSSS